MKVIRAKNHIVVSGVNMKYKTIEDEEYQQRKKII